MEWNRLEDKPDSSGEYLTYSECIGRSLISVYDKRRDKWYRSSGFNAGIAMVEQWAIVPKPINNKPEQPAN